VQLLKRLCKRIKDHTNEIAKLCGYIPLALQIAGTFLAVNSDWTPEEYMKRLKAERLKLLKGNDADPKFDLEAVVALSYRQLIGDERKYWRMLSVFPTSFRREAALALWELDENTGHDLLSKLNRMSLLDYDEKSERYSLHDLLVDYALLQLEDEEEEEARLKHASHYMNVMSVADDLYLKGSDNILLGLRLFDLEWEHIRVGQNWAADNHVKSKVIARLCSNYTSSMYCIDLRLHPRELISWLGAALLADRYLGDRRGEGNALGNLGLAYAALGDARKAIDFYEQRIVIAREIGDRRGEGNALYNMGLALHGLEEKDRAFELVKAALKIYEAIESPVAESARNALKEWGLEG
jgi:tetratricopeptide (TPR) repeat protein